MNKQDKLYCNVVLKNNDIGLKLYYNTTASKLKGLIIYIVNCQNNKYIIDPLCIISDKAFSSILKSKNAYKHG